MKNTKIFTIFAGVNGAGKSTLYYAETNNDLGVRLNADEILHSFGGNWQSSADQVKAGKQLLLMQKDCLQQGISFNRETTLCGVTILNTIKNAKDAGYKIHVRYVGVESVAIAKERIAERVKKGGHGIDDDLLKKRFNESKENLLKIFPLCDRVDLYDNSGTCLFLSVYYTKENGFTEVFPCLWIKDLIQKYITK
jgi:predicted ABC-type ATPase